MDKSFYVLKHNIITSYVLYILSLSKYPKIWYNNTYTEKGGLNMALIKCPKCGNQMSD